MYEREITPFKHASIDVFEVCLENDTMVKLNTKGKPLIIMINGELYGIEEISEIDPTYNKKKSTKFFTIRATNITGQRKLTISLDLRLLDAVKLENGDVSYIR